MNAFVCSMSAAVACIHRLAATIPTRVQLNFFQVDRGFAAMSDAITVHHGVAVKRA
jgi:hypothetical protein